MASDSMMPRFPSDGAPALSPVRYGQNNLRRSAFVRPSLSSSDSSSSPSSRHQHRHPFTTIHLLLPPLPLPQEGNVEGVSRPSVRVVSLDKVPPPSVCPGVPIYPFLSMMHASSSPTLLLHYCITTILTITPTMSPAITHHTALPPLLASNTTIALTFLPPPLLRMRLPRSGFSSWR